MFQGLPEREFWDEVEANLNAVIDDYNWRRELHCKTGQALIMELLLRALPKLVSLLSVEFDRVSVMKLQFIS
jgi:hypothetical protein